MLIGIEWRRSDSGMSLTIQGICRNALNPQSPWTVKSSALAASVLASLSVPYRFRSRRGCCVSGVT